METEKDARCSEMSKMLFEMMRDGYNYNVQRLIDLDNTPCFSEIKKYGNNIDSSKLSINLFNNMSTKDKHKVICLVTNIQH